MGEKLSATGAVVATPVTPAGPVVSDGISESPPTSEGAIEQETRRVLSRSTYTSAGDTLTGLLCGGVRSLSDASSKARVRAVEAAGVLAPFDKDSAEALKIATKDGDPAVRVAALRELK